MYLWQNSIGLTKVHKCTNTRTNIFFMSLYVYIYVHNIHLFTTYIPWTLGVDPPNPSFQ